MQGELVFWSNEDAIAESFRRLIDEDTMQIRIAPKRPRVPFIERDYPAAIAFTILGMAIMALVVVVMGGRLW